LKIKRIRIENPMAALRVLEDEEFVRENMMYVVGVRGERVALRFRRLGLFSFSDEYVLKVVRRRDSLVHFLNGFKSRASISYRVDSDDCVVIRVEFEGPRKWVALPCLLRLAETMIFEAVDRVRSESSASRLHRLSEKLALMSWIAKLLSRSILVKSEIVSVPRGGLVSYIESLLSDTNLRKYRVVYVSGSGEHGAFRIVFVDGSLAGVYINYRGTERSDERALNDFEGFVRIKVYGSMVRDLESLEREL